MTGIDGRVLIIAGSDSGGGAGIQGDIKTVTALGAYAATAITALTAQNTQGVFGVHDVPPAFVSQQMKLVLDDIGADAIKTGMLNSAQIIDSIVDTLAGYSNIPLIVDPVMVAKGGAPLLQAQALDRLKQSLLPIAYVVTPNIPEAELLTGLSIQTPQDMQQAALRIRDMGAQSVLIKGGHLPSEIIIDLLLDESGTFHLMEQSRLPGSHTHGTGCTLASAIAAGIAQGLSLLESVERARRYVRTAIATAPYIGHGHGPLNHAHTVQKFS
jgi:hydroxymethylpyrimidine/phosphomethylpyrimidine kinase